MSRSIEIIQSRVAQEMRISVAAMCGRGRQASVVEARHVGMYLAYANVPHASLPQVAKAFRRLDHTTAIHAVRKVQRKMAQSEDYAQRITAIQVACKQDLARLDALRREAGR